MNLSLSSVRFYTTPWDLTAMKAHLANSPPPTMAGRVSQAMSFFAATTPEQMLHTAAPWKARRLPRHYGQDLCRAA